MQGEGGVTDDGRQLEGDAGVEGFTRKTARDETEAFRLLGRDRVGGEEHLKQLFASYTVVVHDANGHQREKPQMRFRRTKLDFLAGVGQIANQNERQPGAETMAVDAGDERLGEVLQTLDEGGEGAKAPPDFHRTEGFRPIGAAAKNLLSGAG